MHIKDTDIAEKYIKIDKVCKEFNIPIAAAALQFCNANEAVSTMILGMDRPTQIDENINYFNYEINPEFWQKLDELLRHDSEPNDELNIVVGDILEQVKKRGDDALLEFTNRFDRRQATIDELEISRETIVL